MWRRHYGFLSDLELAGESWGGRRCSEEGEASAVPVGHAHAVRGLGRLVAHNETGRAGINTLIRGDGTGCDGIVDEDTATHDPTNPTAYPLPFNSGDSLHPNEASLQTIANAVDLSLFR
jgi:hypothetical protein